MAAAAPGVPAVSDGRLVRLHPVTLRPLSRGARVPAPRARAVSPSGSRVAIASGRTILVADARRLRIVRRVPTGGRVLALAWIAERRLVAVSAGRVSIVDPARGGVLRTEELAGIPIEVLARGGTVASATRDGVAVSRGGAFRRVGTGIGAVSELALSPDGRTAAVFAGARAARVALAGSTMAHADLPLLGRVVDAEWGRGGIAVATEVADREGARPGGAYLVDPRTWRVRAIDPRARGVAATATGVLTFGHVSEPSPRDPELFRMEGIGVRGYDHTGRRRFHVLGEVAVAGVTAHGRYAYVQVWARAWLAVVDLERGRLVRRTVGARTTLLVGPGG